MPVDGYFTEQLPDDISDVIGKLLTWGCCTRCVYRFLGNKDQDNYKKSTEELQHGLQDYLTKTDPDDKSENGNVDMKDEFESSKEGEESKEKVCICCLGILQEPFSTDAFLDRIQQKVVEENYEFSTFFISLTLPVPLILRENSVWILLKELKPAIFSEALRHEVAGVKDAWKWRNTTPLKEKLGAPFDSRSPFEVALFFEHASAMKECNFLLDLFPKSFKQRKHSRLGWELFTKANVMKALGDMSEDRFKRNYQCPARSPPQASECKRISCLHEAIFIAGRYNKYSRTLSQTPWLLDGHRKSESSIEELICEEIKKVVRPGECKFSSSGREDVDVKTLGNGRPFLLEVMNPRRTNFTVEEFKKLQHDINSSTNDIAVRDLQLVLREDTSMLKEGEMEKTKSYSAMCWTEKVLTEGDLQKLSEVKDLVVHQKTPIRVLHRRPLAVREKTIHSISAKLVNEHHFMLYLSTQAGTYVKEFVHGDFGRTSPNLGEILETSCDILQLNVESVELDWPPKIDDY